MTHDPMCPVRRPLRPSCECDFIAEIRADERSKVAQAIRGNRRADQRYVWVGSMSDGSVLVWQDGQYVWSNPR